MSIDLLLTRDDDLAVLGASLTGFTVDAGTATAGDDAVVELVLPPQHLLEHTVDAPPWPTGAVPAQAAGPTRLRFAVVAGRQVGLTVAGVLDACRDLAAGGHRLEIPSRMAFDVVSSPTSVDGAASGPVGSVHPTDPLRVGSAVGLWLARLSAPGTAVMRLRPTDPALAAAADPPGLSPPLDARLRAAVVDSARNLMPSASRLELTALGGSLTADLDLGTGSWAHRATLGRDQTVRVEQTVLLYPFGFHAVLTTLVERDPTVTDIGTPLTDADDLPAVPPGGPAVLRRVRSLRVTRGVRAADDGGRLGRTFPFEQVELLGTTFGPLGGSTPEYTHARVVPDVQARQDAVVALGAQRDAWRAIWGPYVDGQNVDETDLRRRGAPEIAHLDDLRARLAEPTALLEDAKRVDALRASVAERTKRWRDTIDRLMRDNPAGPDGYPSDVQAQIDELEQQIDAVEQELIGLPSYSSNDIARAQEAVTVLTAQILEAQNAVNLLCQATRTIDDAIALGADDPEKSQAAQQYHDTETEYRQEQAWLAAVADLQVERVIAEFPRDLRGDRLRFPVRMTHGAQTVDVVMPLIAVHDVDLQAAPDWDLPAYRSLADPGLAAALDDVWAGTGEDAGRRFADAPAPPSVVDVGGRVLDLVGAARPQPSDLQVLRTLNIVARDRGELFEPSLGRVADAATGAAARWGMGVDLPALQRLGGDLAGVDTSAYVRYARDFVDNGEAARVLLETVDPVVANFSEAADRTGGLAAVAIAADAVSRAEGVVTLAAMLEGDPDPIEVIGESATLLGFSLQDLLEAAVTAAGDEALTLVPPRIVADAKATATDAAAQVQSMADATVELQWTAPLGDVGPFKTNDVTPVDSPERTHLELTVVADRHATTTRGRVNDVALQFPPDDAAALVRVSWTEIVFTQQTRYAVDVAPGTSPTATAGADVGAPQLALHGFDLQLLGALQLLADLQNKVDLGPGPKVTAGPKGVSASLALPVPDVRCGAFALSNVDFHSNVDLPFDGRPVTVGFGFARRDRPFSLSVLAFAGGGYVEVVIDADGPHISAALEFGAQIAVDFVVARGELHAIGGVEYRQDGDAVAISGYLRLGGTLEILGLIAVTVELRISLAYDSGPRRLVGRATLVLAVDLTFWSDSVEIDSGEWVLAGGDDPGVATRSLGPADAASNDLVDLDAAFAALDDDVDDDAVAAWQSYRAGVPA